MKIVIAAPLYASNFAHIDFIEETLDSIKSKHDIEVVLIENYVAPQLISKVKAFGYKILPNPLGNNVSSAWNEGIKYGFNHGADYVLIPNLDIIFREDTIDIMVEYAEKNKINGVVTAGEWTEVETIHTLKIEDNEGRLKVIGKEEHHWDEVDSHPHFSCFMVNKKGLKNLRIYEEGLAEPLPGLFDVNYDKAYFEDQDFHQRILLAESNGIDITGVRINRAIFFHYGSRTIKSDGQLEMENTYSYEKNREYYAKKFGYDSHGKVPTNEERVKLSYKTPFNKLRAI